MAGVSGFMRRHHRHTNPLRFWLETIGTFVVLAGLFDVVTIAAWLFVYLST